LHSDLISSLENLTNHGLRSVILIGGGEPTLYSMFCELVSFLKEKGLQVAIVSNGSNGNVIAAVAELLNGNDWVRYSVDAGSENSFANIHNPNLKKNIISLAGVCANARMLRGINANLQLGYSFVITWDSSVVGGNIVSNISEIASAARLAKENGFTYISYKPFLSRGLNQDECLDKKAIMDFETTIDRIKEEIKKAKEYEDVTFKVLLSTNLKLLLSGKDADFRYQPTTCHMTAFRQVLSPHGLFNCPAYRGVERACIGNLNAYSSLDEGKQTISNVAKHILRFNARHMCKNITCLYNPTNWFVERLINNDLSLSSCKMLSTNIDYFL
jgi:wyosine [tRNA(Phe)-imidazoG37] synthetase (radical SAM superfamily)